MNIFETLPNNFFNVFNNSEKTVMSECIYLLYNYMHDDSSFVTLKENIIFELTKYFNTHINTIEYDDSIGNSAKDNANRVYKRLKDAGWINEEIGNNYQKYVSFEDYAISIIETLFNLDKDNDIEYSSRIFSIHSAFKQFDIENGHKVLDMQYRMTQELMLKLKNLNTNIKRHIRKLVTENVSGDLNKLLDSLLNEYQLKIVDRAFYNFTTKDHPYKYRKGIISSIETIRESEECTRKIIENIMNTKDIDYDEAAAIYSEQTLFIIDAFENISNLVDEIGNKNKMFVANSVNRILFLMNAKDDISGKINQIIKDGHTYFDMFENIVNINVNKNLDINSLYYPSKARKINSIDTIEDVKLDEQRKQEVLNKIQLNQKYTQRNIDNYIKEKLMNEKSIKGSDLLQQQNDISLFILTIIYGFNVNLSYEIEKLNKKVGSNNYNFTEFVIKERKKDE